MKNIGNWLYRIHTRNIMKHCQCCGAGAFFRGAGADIDSSGSNKKVKKLKNTVNVRNLKNHLESFSFTCFEVYTKFEKMA